MIFEFGPFDLYRVRDSGTLDISIRGVESCGWEYGWDDPAAFRKPLVSIRVGKLAIFQFEKFPKGFELWILGFWWTR